MIITRSSISPHSMTKRQSTKVHSDTPNLPKKSGRPEAAKTSPSSSLTFARPFFALNHVVKLLVIQSKVARSRYMAPRYLRHLARYLTEYGVLFRPLFQIGPSRGSPEDLSTVQSRFPGYSLRSAFSLCLFKLPTKSRQVPSSLKAAGKAAKTSPSLPFTPPKLKVTSSVYTKYFSPQYHA